jgi:hypothetical protein
VIAYQTASTSGNADWHATVGLDFDALVPINISQLGTFDSQQNGFGPKTTITVSIWQRDTHGTATTNDDTGSQLLASLRFTAASPGTLIGAYRFQPLATPLLLSPGAYSIVAQGYDRTDLMLSESKPGAAPVLTDDGGGLVQFVGTGRLDWSGTADSFPTTTGAVAGLANPTPAMFGAGDIMYRDPPILPEPSSGLLVGVGLLGLGGWAGYRRQRQGRTAAA